MIPAEPDRGSESTYAGSSAAGLRWVGPYRLLEKIGEGGMGEVWLAEQQRPIQRQVALKIIKLGMDTREVVARFETERQALAMMNHPAIARVFDGGPTQEGRPFFVMEYVPGIPITDHCDRARLHVLARLELFLQVCAGVQHAHHKAIIHRDLKPSNVLIAIQDGNAVPKIIDFGVAKATGQRLTEKTVFTQLGFLIGTPEYMSPEQAELTGQDIDTRTDVYALGVMLYELLTGVRPLELRESSEGLESIRRKIREEEPPKPSTRITTLAAPVEMAGRRQTNVSGLKRELSGDLDWITMKALEKDRTRRYGSPMELAADIERHLTDQPVLACPPSTLYRAGRFARRHRFGVGIASASVLVLLAFAVAMALLAGRVAQERDRASEQAQAKQRIADFLKELFTVSNPSQARGNSITAREILDEGVKKIDQALKDQPNTRADLLATMGDAYQSLGLYGEADRLTRGALDLRRRLLGDDDVLTMDSMSSLAYLAKQQGRYEETERLLKQSLEAERRVFGADHRRTLHSKSQLANVYTLQGRLAEAAALFLEVASTQRRVLGDDHADTLVTLNDLTVLYEKQGRMEEGAKLTKEILERRQRVLGEDHPDTVLSMNNLGYFYQSLGRYDEARQLTERAVGIGERIWGPRHPRYGFLVHTLGELALATGDLDAAESHLLHAQAIYTLQPDYQQLPVLLYQLSQVSARRGKPDRALDFLTDALVRGYKHGGTPQGFIDDPAFFSLRGNPRFAKMASEARAKAKSR